MKRIGKSPIPLRKVENHYALVLLLYFYHLWPKTYHLIISRGHFFSVPRLGTTFQRVGKFPSVTLAILALSATGNVSPILH